MNVDRISTMVQLKDLPTPSSGEQFKKMAEMPKSADGETKSDQVQLQISIPRQTLDTLQKIGSITGVLNDTAKSLRATGSGLTAAADMAEKMRASLEKIVKNFPPFPIDSAERKDLLMSYRALQKEMEKMMIPPPPLLVLDKVQKPWQSLFGQNRTGTVSTPALPENASDAAVADAAKQLASTGDMIASVHAAIGDSL